MKRYLLNFMLVAAFLIGVGLLLYPTISEYVNSKTQTHIIESYNETVNNLSTLQNEEYLRAARQYNDRLAKTESAFYHPKRVEGYMDALNTTISGVMGYISIDKIKVELPIYHTVDETVLQVGAGHLEGSSLPVGGINTHCVISGHRGLPSAKLFSDLDKLEIGDIFYITVLNEIYTYQVDQIKTVLPNEVDDLQLCPGKDYCTLFTCTPYGINTHRLLVRGTRIEPPEERTIYISNEAFSVSTLLVALVVAIPMLLLLLLMLIISSIRADLRARKKSN